MKIQSYFSVLHLFILVFCSQIRAQPELLTESKGPGGIPPANFWSVDPTQYENSMTLIGMLEKNGENVTSSTMELGAFVGTQVRGSSQSIYIPPFNSYLFFLTVYANSNGEQLKYKLFDSSNGSIQDLNETMYFSPDLHQGSIENPVSFSLLGSSTTDLALNQSFEVQPNPFHSETMVRFALSAAQELAMTVIDANGHLVSTQHITASEGLNTMIWKGQSDSGTPLAAGVYFVRLQTTNGSVVRKVVLQ